MQAFEVHLNGKRLCKAGIDGDSVLSASVNALSREDSHDLFLQVGGLITASEDRLIWQGHLALTVGDEIALRIVETDAVDIPEQRYRTNSKEDEQNSKAYVLAIAQKYGWKLILNDETPTLPA